MYRCIYKYIIDVKTKKQILGFFVCHYFLSECFMLVPLYPFISHPSLKFTQWPYENELLVKLVVGSTIIKVVIARIIFSIYLMCIFLIGERSRVAIA